MDIESLSWVWMPRLRHLAENYVHAKRDRGQSRSPISRNILFLRLGNCFIRNAPETAAKS